MMEIGEGGGGRGGHVGFREQLTSHGGGGGMPKGRDARGRSRGGGGGGQHAGGGRGWSRSRRRPTCRRAGQRFCRQNAWRAEPRAEALPLRVF
jgi:hypothetical protein